MSRAALIALWLMVAGCGRAPITPDDVPRLQQGQTIKVHVWAPGGPGPGAYMTGVYEGQDAEKLFLNVSGKRMEIYRGEIHDDTRDVR